MAIVKGTHGRRVVLDPEVPVKPLSKKEIKVQKIAVETQASEDKYFQFLRDKRVVIVGPAGYLKGQGRGAEFDDYDLIVRLNLACPVAEGLKADVGSRTDVLYHIIIKNEHVRQRPDLFKHHTRQEVESWKADGVKWVVVRQTSINNRVGGFAPAVAGAVDWLAISHAKMERIRGTFKTMPNIGTVAMWHILEAPVKELYVAGCDFHLSGYYETYGGFDADQAARGKRSDGGMNRCWGQVPQQRKTLMHAVPPQIEGLSRIYEKDARFKCDKELRKLFKNHRRSKP